MCASSVHCFTTTSGVPCVMDMKSYMKEKGMRMGQLFELMVAWARDAPEEDLLPPTTQGKQAVASF